MIRLVKGNSERLTGEVVSYASMPSENLLNLLRGTHKNPTNLNDAYLDHLRENFTYLESGGEAYIGLYATNDPITFSTRRKTPREDLEGALKKVSEDFKEKGMQESRTLKMFCALELRSREIDIRKSAEDALYTGRFRSFGRTMNAINLGLTVYCHNLIEQTENRIGEDISLGNKSSEILPPEKTAEEHLWSKYASPMIDALSRKDLPRFEKLRTGLISYSQGSLYFSAVLNFCDEMTNTGLYKRDDLVREHIRLMGLVSEERFEEAAKIRDALSDSKK